MDVEAARKIGVRFRRNSIECGESPPHMDSRYFRQLTGFFVAIAAYAMLGNAHAIAAEDTRFTSTLSTSQRTESGLDLLTSDNIAVIDALVRQDEATLKRRGSLASFGTFSQRRSEQEKEISGIAKLTPAQLTRLDGLAGVRISPPPPMPMADGSAPQSSSGMLLKVPGPKPYALEVHGSMSLTYGWSKAGSVRGGDFQVSVQDPARRFSLSVGYSEYHGEGLNPVYDPYDESYRYRAARNPPAP